MTVVDIFSRFTWLEKLKTRDAAAVGEAFRQKTVRAGVSPDSLMSDNGGEFGGEFDDVLKELDVKHRRVRSHTPQANGIVERRNAEVRKVVRSIMLS